MDCKGAVREYEGHVENRLDIASLAEFNRYGLDNAGTHTIDLLMKNLTRGNDDLEYYLLASPHNDEHELLSYASYLPRPALHDSHLPYKSLDVLHKHQFIVDIVEEEELHLDVRVYLGVLCEENTDQIFYLCARQNTYTAIKSPQRQEALVLEIPMHQYAEEERLLLLHQHILRPLWGHSLRLLSLLETNIAQAKEIEKHKYLLSEKEGHDVGGIYAATDWIRHHASGYRTHIQSRLKELRTLMR